MIWVGFSLGVSTYSVAIRAAQRTVGCRYQALTHVYLTDGATIREALSGRGIVERPCGELERDHPYIEVPFADTLLGHAVWAASERYIGRPYDTSAAFRAPWRRTGLIDPDEDTSERLFCSEYLAQSLRDVLPHCSRVAHPEAVLPAHVAEWPVLNWGLAEIVPCLPQHYHMTDEWILKQ